MSQLAIELIRKAKETNAKELDLGMCGLSVIPLEVFELKQLESLILSDGYIDYEKKCWIRSKNTGTPNNIFSLPDNIKNLSNLSLLKLNNAFSKIRDVANYNILKELKKLISLDLGSNKLTDISFLTELKNLTTVDLRNNNLTDVSFLKGLKNLKTLDLSFNNLTDVSFLKELKNLTTLYLSYNKLTDVSFLKELKNLTTLHLGSNNLTDVSFLKELKNLTIVELWNNNLTDVSFLAELKNLTTVDLWKNNLTDVNFLVELKNLTTLSLSTNNLTDFSFLKELKNLNELRLESNNLTDLSFVKEFKKLTSLDLRSNFLSDLDNLKELKSLNYLNLRVKKVTDVSFLKSLKKLDELNLSHNDLSEIVDWSGLENLTLLSLTSTNLKDFSFLKQIKNLRILYLATNNLSEVTFLEDMKKLTNLVLSNNNLADGNVLKELKNLSYLDLRNNKITDASFLRELNNLTTLNLSDNNLTDVSFLKEFNQLQYLELENNPIKNPPKNVWKAGIDSIRNYYKELESAPTEEFLYEAKMVMIGRGESGKTVLTKKLTNPNFHFNPKEPTTKGISVLKNPFNLMMTGLNNSDTYKFNIWDFGGQTKYDLAHQFFITKKSIYLLLTEARHEDNYLEFENWLNLINLLGEDSRIIVVVSKIDERKKRYPKDQYMKQYPNIHDFVELSCVDGYEKNIEHLKEKIKEAVMFLPQSNQKLPSTWVDIRKKLETLARKKDFITYKEYLRICKQFKFNQERADFLSDYLNALGVIIHRQDDILLKNIVILRIDWGIDAIYKVLDNKEVEKEKGFFTEKTVRKIWRAKKYSDKQSELLALMLNYKLAFKCKDDSGYIVPILLQPNKPGNVDWNYDDNLRFEYTYEYMPPGIISRFIVEAHHMIYENNYWRFGLKIRFDDTFAIVQEDYIKKRITILISGKDKHGLLSIIRNLFAEVHKKFERLKPKEWIPCNCEQCEEDKQRNIDPTFYEYSLLINYLIQGIDEIRCSKSKLNTVKVLLLIQNVFAIKQDLNLEDIFKLLKQIESKTIGQDDMQRLIDSILTGKDMDNDVAYKFSEIIKLKIPLGFADIDLSKLYQNYIHRKKPISMI